MILRPVSPVSAFGPPISNRPVGFTSTRTPEASSSGNSRSTGSITSASMSGFEQRLDIDLLAVLRR